MAKDRAGDARLTGSKYLWLRRPEALSDAQRAAFRALHRQDLKVGRAWALKERFRTFWEYRYPGAARTFFARWFWRATHSRLKPMAAVAKLIQRHLPNLLTYLRHRLAGRRPACRHGATAGGQAGHGRLDRSRSGGLALAHLSGPTVPSPFAGRS